MPTHFTTVLVFCCIGAALCFHLQGTQGEDVRTIMRLLDSPRNIHSFSALALPKQLSRFTDTYRNRVRKWYDWGDGLSADKKWDGLSAEKKWYDWQDVPTLVAVSSNNGKREEKDAD